MSVNARLIKSAVGAVLPIEKAALTTKEAGEWVSAPYPRDGMRLMVEQSTILRQAIDAYAHNIAGYGFLPEYIEETSNDTAKEAEWNKLQETLDWMGFDEPLTKVFKQLVNDRETVGEAFIEVLRDNKGEVIELIRVNPDDMEVSKPGAPVEVTIERMGIKKTAQRAFRRFRRGQKQFFKQFNDPRQMDRLTGDYLPESSIGTATEIVHWKLGDADYGIPRWIGHVPSLAGARKAEELNYRYFTQGRHLPGALIISGGELTEKSEAQIAQYANEVGTEGTQHKMLVLEVDAVNENLTGEGGATAPKVELKSLADMLQKDALFLEYDDKARDKLLSVFRLPPVYVGLSSDYNRATVEEARRIAEEQVFQPERMEIEMMFNRLLLPSYGFKHVKVALGAPELTDGELIIAAVEKAGASLSVNEKRAVIGPLLGKELEPLPDEQYDLPSGDNVVSPTQQLAQATGEALAKAEGGVIKDVLKDVRDELNELNDVVGGWKGEGDV
ncbi:phage portal protein [Exiguobacterium antarcticum]|uniref:phage portal protein n=1 Tax=Exiguobacterium antarcticum TaxID=132920 RepID=UPI000690C950|nr:phage portal protein [Exiguobacterium antarcticum]